MPGPGRSPPVRTGLDQRRPARAGRPPWPRRRTSAAATTITSASVTPSILGEGQTVTLNAAFTDPNVTDAHTVEILWRDGTKDKLQLAAGQLSIQATHTYVDNTSSPAHI